MNMRNWFYTLQAKCYTPLIVSWVRLPCLSLRLFGVWPSTLGHQREIYRILQIQQEIIVTLFMCAQFVYFEGLHIACACFDVAQDIKNLIRWTWESEDDSSSTEFRGLWRKRLHGLKFLGVVVLYILMLRFCNILRCLLVPDQGSMLSKSAFFDILSFRMRKESNSSYKGKLFPVHYWTYKVDYQNRIWLNIKSIYTSDVTSSAVCVVHTVDTR